MTKQDNSKVDEGLQGNEKIEDAILGLQKESTKEMLAHTLSVIRLEQIQIQAVQTSDGQSWWTAFTSFEEELKGGDSVKSTFLTDIDKLFETVLQVEKIQGIILNPWNRTIMLDKNLIRVILGAKA